MFERIGGILPRGIRTWVGGEIRFAGLDYNAERYVGFAFTFALIAGIAAYIISMFLKFGDSSSILFALGGAVFALKPYLIGAFFVGFGAVFGGAIFWITNAADARGDKAEKALPDALQLIASNIKAGQTTERSLFVSARPEFGALSDALREASKKIMVGERLEHALLHIHKTIKSKVVERTMWLIAEGIKNGGQIANLLVQMSTDLREENALKAEVNSNTSMYVMLIFFSAAFGAPMLLGISSFIVGVLSAQTANVHIDPNMISQYSSQNRALGLVGIPSSTISEDFIVMFSIVDLVVTSIFAAMVLGVINSGTEKAGMKYFPILLIVSIVLFFVTRVVVKTFFTGFAG